MKMANWLRSQRCNSDLEFTTLFDEDGEFLLEKLQPIQFHHFLLSRRSSSGERLSSSTYSTFRSALRFLFREKGLSLPDSFKIPNEDFFRGLKRVDAREKQSGHRPIGEGEDPLPFMLYCTLARQICI
jgi:hypothetical protein